MSHVQGIHTMYSVISSLLKHHYLFGLVSEEQIMTLVVAAQ